MSPPIEWPMTIGLSRWRATAAASATKSVIDMRPRSTSGPLPSRPRKLTAYAGMPRAAKNGTHSANTEALAK